jgi:hypothetical protein
LFAKKKYSSIDYAIVLCMVAGLALFMHADSTSSAVFHYAGVLMLTISLLCDGAISNVSETIMSQYGVGQDEFIFRMYSIALVAIALAAAYRGDLTDGLLWMSQPGTYHETVVGHEKFVADFHQRSWPVVHKMIVIVLFSSMGFFGSSCSAGITKQFGALAMSITSTARKATTLFLSFFLFNNVCTVEHLLGVLVFITALTAKSLRRSKHHHNHHHHPHGSSSSGKHNKGKKLKSIMGENSNGNNQSFSESFPPTSTIAIERSGSFDSNGVTGVNHNRRRRKIMANGNNNNNNNSTHAGSNQLQLISQGGHVGPIMDHTISNVHVV